MTDDELDNWINMVEKRLNDKLYFLQTTSRNDIKCVIECLVELGWKPCSE